jgi:hypothetical protein
MHSRLGRPERAKTIVSCERADFVESYKYGEKKRETYWTVLPMYFVRMRD